MPKLMNSSHNSVENLRIQRNTLQEALLMMTAILMEPPIRDGEFLNPKCHGSPEKRKPDEAATKTVRNHAEYSTSSLVTTKSLKNGFRLPEPLLRDSQHPSGIISSEDNQSTSMQCSHHCTTFQLLKRTLDAWACAMHPVFEC